MPVIKPDNLNIEEPEPKRNGIAWHIENAFVRIFKRVFNAIKDILLELLASSLYRFVELLEPGIKEGSDDILREMSKLPGLNSAVKQSLEKTLTGEHQSQSLLSLIYSVAGLIGLASGPSIVSSKISAYEVDRVLRTGRANPLELWQMARRGVIDDAPLHKYFEDMGLPDDIVQGYQALTQNLLESSDLANALFRGEIGEEYFAEMLRKKGYSATDAKTIRELVNIIPGPNDLIRMSVREAFDDSVVRQFGYDDNFPAEFGEWSEKQGLSKEWSKRYWRAHWEIPGVREGFEMLHRDIIDEDEMRLLLRVKDFPTFWRDRLIQLSYQPYTRVDVRRMYQLGVVDEDEVFRNYLDLGYDDEKAKKLTDWTILEYAQTEIELSKADILGSYQEGILREDEATLYLSGLGYGEGEIGLFLARADLKKQQAYEKELIQNVRVSFVAGILDENGVYAQLAEINPPAGFIEERLKLWRLQRERGIRKPTITNLRDFWLTGIIEEGRLRTELKNLGYADIYIQLYIDFWTRGKEE